MNSSYTIYNASAGAGKTYTLVKNFLSILLKNENPESIRSILAITFTNKAANEMKVRIISWLKEFSDDQNYLSNSALQQISKELGVDVRILHERAQKALSYILHHYSLLSVSTIDKFNLRLMKSFTKELGLSYSFSVELDASDYLKQSIDELIDQLGTENPFAEVILNYIFWKFENESSTDVRKELLISSQNFLKEMHLDKIASVTKKDFEDFKTLSEIILKRIKFNNQQIKESATKAVSLIEDCGLEIIDFFQGARGMGGFFYKVLNEEQIKVNYEGVNLSSNYYRDFCENEKYAKSKSPRESDIQAIAPQLIQFFYEIKNWVNRIRIDESVRQNLVTIELQSEITRFLNDKKTDRDILFLSDVNPIISKHLKDEPVAFIYEKLGGRYNHYFIDEFQDTSQLQWDNLLPLVDNAKITNGTSITLVGDPKQAIYRFRSGKPEILIDLITTAEDQNIQVNTLQDNYRSLPNIVDFNNRLYQFLADTQLGSLEYKKLFGEQAQQFPKLKEGGRVQVSFTPQPDEEVNYLAQRTLEIIEESIQNGFKFRDIAVLVRNKRHSFPIVDLLADKGYPILTEEALQVSASPVIDTIIAALKWIDTPNDYEHLIFMLYQLWRLKKINIVDFTTEILNIKELSVPEILVYLRQNLGIKLKMQLNSNLSFFDYVEELIGGLAFGETEEMYISALLDFILQQEKGGIISLSEFLENWEIKSRNLSIRFPDNMDAIQIMTIHKSKGLEFPVVVYPIFNNKSNKEEYWFPLEKDLYNGFEQYYTSSKKGLEEVSDDIKGVVEGKEFERKIDELCVQYVATTRASQQLFLIEERKENAKEKSPLQIFLEAHAYNTEGTVELYPLAEVRKMEDNKKLNMIKEEKIGWCSASWTEKIKVSTEVRKFYSEENKDIQYGNIIHAVLAEVTTNETLSEVIKKMTLVGLAENIDEEELQKIIKNVMQSPELVKYFMKEAKVYNEQEILFEGRFYRPDRLVEIDDKFAIIDFKTGEKLPKHKKQIEVYADALQSFGKRVEEKILVYIKKENIDIVKV